MSIDNTNNHQENSMSSDSTNLDPNTLAPGLLKALERINAAYAAASDGQPVVPGLPTGFTAVDEMVGGYRPGQLIVLVGAPGVGTTSKALADAYHIATNKSAPRTVAFISLSSCEDELVERLISMVARVEVERMRRGTLRDGDIDRILQAMHKLRDARLVIKDAAYARHGDVVEFADDVAHAASATAGAAPLGLVVVEGLRLAVGEFDDNVRALKRLAKSLGVTVLVTLGIHHPDRPNKRPIPKDVDDAAFAHADLLQALYRGEMYDDYCDDPGVAEIITLKHRTGPTGICKIGWSSHLACFYNLSGERQ